MNTVFIFGNGFDLNLGLKTSYNDFYQFYFNEKSNNKNINKLKDNISKGINNWADLEIALGNYTENLKSLEEFDEVYEDIGEKLSIYLNEQENSFEPSKFDSEVFLKCLAFPEEHIPFADKEKILDFKESYKANYWKINIITLNFTSIIEKLIGHDGSKINIGHFDKQTPITLDTIEHLHGYVDNRMVLGVNDLSQIKNKSFHENLDITDSLIKNNCNQASKHKIDNLCESQIYSAKLICIFGSSLGETDKIWWELIGNCLKNKCYLIIFSITEQIPSRLEHKKARREREVKNLFLSRTSLNDEEKKEVYDKIIIVTNSDIFKM